jgi:hypothetical protein
MKRITTLCGQNAGILVLQAVRNAMNTGFKRLNGTWTYNNQH